MALTSCLVCKKCSKVSILSKAQVFGISEDYLEREFASFFCDGCQTRQIAYIESLTELEIQNARRV